MSASREKKQRQGTGPDQRAVRAQQEQAARKRTTIIYSVIAAVVAVLVIALLVWRSGFFQARAAAVTVGSETLSTAELSYYYYDARRTYATYGSIFGFDTTKSDEDQYYNAEENVTFRDHFMTSALTAAQRHLALAEEAVRQGHTEAEVKDDLDAAIKSLKEQAASAGYGYAAYLRMAYGPYMSAGVYEKLYTRYLMASLAANENYDALYDGYTQADLDAYYKDNADSLDTIEYSYLYFPIGTVSSKDAEGNDLPEDEVTRLEEEAKATAKSNAEAALAAVQSGSTFTSQAEKYELTSSADHVKGVGTSTVNTSFSEELFKLSADQCQLVELETGWYVISFHGRYLEDEATRDVRHIVLLADTTTDESGNVVAPTDEAWAAAKAEMDAVQAEWEGSAKTEEAFSALAAKYSADSSASNGGLIERIASDSRYVPEFMDWIFPAEGQRSAGDVDVVQHTARDSDGNKYWGYHLMYYVGENEPVWMASARESLADEAQTAWMDQIAEGYPTAQASGADYFGR